MAGKINVTYQVQSGTNRTPAQGPNPAVAPVLESFDLFPTRIWQSHLEPLVSHLDRWVKVVLAMRAANPKPAGRTVRQGWNSADMTLLQQPEFAPLQTAVRAACASALGEMGKGNIAFSLQSWINLHDR